MIKNLFETSKIFEANSFVDGNARKCHEKNENNNKTRSNKNQPNWNIYCLAKTVTQNRFQNGQFQLFFQFSVNITAYKN